MSEPHRENLTATVVKLRARIQQYRERKETIGEQDTKAALIDPLLSSLGWNLEEIEEFGANTDEGPRITPSIMPFSCCGRRVCLWKPKGSSRI